MTDVTASSLGGVFTSDASIQEEAIAYPSDIPLPMLRPDLRLLPAAADPWGQPAWTIHDPVRNRYFRIGMSAFEYLVRWKAGTINRLMETVQSETLLESKEADIEEIIRFLRANGLVQRPDPQAPAAFARIAASSKRGWFQQALQGYLFFRIPLFRPTSFLRATQPVADIFASNFMQIVIAVLGLVGLYLTGRQWDLFVSTFQGYLNWQGAVATAVTLTCAKILHEFGHAYSVTRYGGRVPTMGVAFLVMYPVLYTDTTDAWRLTSRKERLSIGTAGIRVELALALVATFFWSFLPEGPVRSAAFLLATATWISTLAINLSPFMRFDGYYILSDLLDIANLQPRAFALARWWMRETLFGFGLAPPETFPRKTHYFLIGYSLATWIYRFLLFLGIALVVYHMFFKVVGIALFAAEMYFFIVGPILREIVAWNHLRKMGGTSRRAIVTLLALASALILFFVPWRSEVSAPALLSAGTVTEVVLAYPARLTGLEVADGDVVHPGMVIARLESPELDSSLVLNEARIREARGSLEQARRDDRRRGESARLEEELSGLVAARAKVVALRQRLIVRAQSEGVVRDIPRGLTSGTWLQAGMVIGRIVSADSRIVAYLDQTDLPRIRPGAPVRLITEDPTRAAVHATLESVSRYGAESLDSPYLASVNGGMIPTTRREKDGQYVPRGAVYRLDISPASADTLLHPMRGQAMIEAEAESIAARVWRMVAVVLVREMSF